MQENENNQKPNMYKIYRIVGRLEGLMQSMDKKVDVIIENHDKRINTVESKTDKMEGRAAGIGAIAAIVISIIVAFFKK